MAQNHLWTLIFLSMPWYKALWGIWNQRKQGHSVKMVSPCSRKANGWGKGESAGGQLIKKSSDQSCSQDSSAESAAGAQRKRENQEILHRGGGTCILAWWISWNLPFGKKKKKKDDGEEEGIQSHHKECGDAGVRDTCFEHIYPSSPLGSLAGPGEGDEQELDLHK